VETSISDPFWTKFCRVLLACALLAVPACGLSDYEKLMQETQKREERFREEKKYLDEPVKIPTRKDKEDHDVALADAFFRPPKGIQPTGEEEPNKRFWRYRPGKSGSEFLQVELAFAEDNNTFPDDVQRIYPRKGQTPQWTPPLPFDSWEYDEGQYTYTVNVSQTAPKAAVVFIVGKGRAAHLRKVMALSLQSLAVGPDAGKARQRANRKSSWQLDPKARGGDP
jgi:hypothetical protein